MRHWNAFLVSLLRTKIGCGAMHVLIQSQQQQHKDKAAQASKLAQPKQIHTLVLAKAIPAS
jgi:hypothetical protein